MSRIALSCCVLILAAAPAAAVVPVTAELAVSTVTSDAVLDYTAGLRLADVVAREAQAQALLAANRPDAGYQKQTEFDNTPYRFNMKPGEKLNAEQFDAWMASRGIRIVPAKAAAEPATAVVAN